MKKVLRFALVGALILGAASCDDDDDNNPTPPPTSEVDGGTLSGGPFEFTIGDGIADNVSGITLEGNVGESTQWVVTDADSNILELPENIEDVNFEEAGVGLCLIWNLSFNGTLQGAAVGNNAADIQGDFKLSNSIRVNRLYTIAGIVKNNENFTSLLAALQKAELDGVLDGEGTFTVFAPTNDAFDEFLGGLGLTLESVPKDVLTQVLLNHVIGTEVFSSELTNSYVNNLATFNGEDGKNLSTYINVDDGVKINGIATVTTPDVDATNGVVHIVDKVIPLPSVVTFAAADPNFSSLVTALTREMDFTYVETLSTDNGTAPAPFTVFAPTNDAFGAVLNELGLNSLADIPTETLSATLNTHVVAGANVRASEVTAGDVTTLGGDITLGTDGGVTVTDQNDRTSTVVAADVQAANGVIHAVDTVILPKLN